MSHSVTTRLTTTLAEKTMMLSQVEPFSGSASTIDFALRNPSCATREVADREPAMVPPETPLPMRRQPTPMLIGPLRWSVWTLMTQSLSSLIRRSRYSLGYERD